MTDPKPAITFTLDPTTRIRTATFVGWLGAVDVRMAYDALYADPGYVEDAADLVDLRRVTHLELSVDDIRALMERNMPHLRRGPRTRYAVVAPSPLSYGLARMFERMGGESFPKEISVFREFEPALAWLTAR